MLQRQKRRPVFLVGGDQKHKEKSVLQWKLQRKKSLWRNGTKFWYLSVFWIRIWLFNIKQPMQGSWGRQWNPSVIGQQILAAATTAASATVLQTWGILLFLLPGSLKFLIGAKTTDSNGVYILISAAESSRCDTKNLVINRSSFQRFKKKKKD